MILAVDVNYDQKRARAAGVLFSNWTAAQPYSKFISILDEVKKYIPGEFYKRELPCILKLINEHKLRPQIIIVDGYVYLDGNTKPGLGKYLFDQLNGKIPIIGVAKNPYKDITSEYEVYRGGSKRPLYVTSAGIPINKAKNKIRSMHGIFRIPDMLRLVDQHARQQ